MLLWDVKLRLNKNALMNGHLFGDTSGSDLRSGVLERSCRTEMWSEASAHVRTPQTFAPKTAETSSPRQNFVDTEDVPVERMTERTAPNSSSASRQKSCHACVKGKRGCDKRHPVCSRCEEKKVRCIYAKRTYAEAFYDLYPMQSDMPWAGLTTLSSSIDFVDDVPPSVTSSAIVDTTRLPLDAFVDPFLNVLEHPLDQNMSSSDMQLISSADEPLGQQQEKQAVRKFDYVPMADLCVCNSS